jgi:hypothetical protein
MVVGHALLAGGGVCGREEAVEARQQKRQLGGGGAGRPDLGAGRLDLGAGWPDLVEISLLRLPLTIHGVDPAPKCGGSADPRRA